MLSQVLLGINPTPGNFVPGQYPGWEGEQQL